MLDARHSFLVSRTRCRENPLVILSAAASEAAESMDPLRVGLLTLASDPVVLLGDPSGTGGGIETNENAGGGAGATKQRAPLEGRRPRRPIRVPKRQYIAGFGILAGGPGSQPHNSFRFPAMDLKCDAISRSKRGCRPDRVGGRWGERAGMRWPSIAMRAAEQSEVPGHVGRVGGGVRGWGARVWGGASLLAGTRPTAVSQTRVRLHPQKTARS
jgi:hypothetical protein